jgi:GR25 family glycosyltransferase involved in LPS biosynthesis
MDAVPDPGTLEPSYSLADQLTIDPNPLLQIDAAARQRHISMTRPEIAVALSHIEAWRRVATGSDAAALILEDDVVFLSGFARGLADTWRSLLGPDGAPDFDLLYLAFKDVGNERLVSRGSAHHRHQPGLWEAAAYVLTREGARRLLDRLPAHGPVDLWLNLQFGNICAYSSRRPLIAQRIDEPSTNAYSVLPVLSQVGVITTEKALLPPRRKLRGPVIAVGEPSSGLTALAEALSMLGYTCLSDLDHMPDAELHHLLAGDKGECQFNAYVNIGDLNERVLRDIAAANPTACFIRTASSSSPSDALSGRSLHLELTQSDKWEPLTDLLGVSYPAFAYPASRDLGQRRAARPRTVETPSAVNDLTFDRSPWVLPGGGVPIATADVESKTSSSTKWSAGDSLDQEIWFLRDDTFPSNLALFRPSNVNLDEDGMTLAMRAEKTPVRAFTAGAVAARAPFLYGSFAAELRTSGVAGVVTGLFLHRNGPRQEIDIEFLGRDTSTMLVNVFYNPGPEGAKLEYGYRGTPTEIKLGFDAAADFHLYEIDWRPDRIDWKVDGVTVYRRHLWAPTPIPDLPMELNINVWHSRSTEFAGQLDAQRLPATVNVRAINVAARG